MLTSLMLTMTAGALRVVENFVQKRCFSSTEKARENRHWQAVMGICCCSTHCITGWEVDALLSNV